MSAYDGRVGLVGAAFPDHPVFAVLWAVERRP